MKCSVCKCDTSFATYGRLRIIEEDGGWGQWHGVKSALMRAWKVRKPRLRAPLQMYIRLQNSLRAETIPTPLYSVYTRSEIQDAYYWNSMASDYHHTVLYYAPCTVP
jgi:hypothetical protein